MQKHEPTFWSSQADPHKLLARVGNGRTTANYRKYQASFEQGQVADTVFFIQQGHVKISVTSEHGREAVVAILDAGQFFGEGCLDDHDLRPSSAHD